MKTLLIIFLGLFIACSSEQKKEENKFNPIIIELNKRVATLVPYIDNVDSTNKAISLLNDEIAIDSTYYPAYYMKITFLTHLKKYDKAIPVINELLKMKPYAHDLYLTGGSLYEIIGDTLTSKAYFEKSLKICKTVLDTMSIEHRNYDMLVIDKAVNLIMLGDQTSGNQILKQFYNKQTDTVYQKFISTYMNMSKKELANFLANEYSR